MSATPETTCQVCGRREGDTSPPGDGPLGPIEQCKLSKLWVCPDCMHEVLCCFMDEEEHEDDPDWAPPGWRCTSDGWERIEQPQQNERTA